jgi:hypothetical protein
MPSRSGLVESAGQIRTGDGGGSSSTFATPVDPLRPSTSSGPRPGDEPGGQAGRPYPMGQLASWSSQGAVESTSGPLSVTATFCSTWNIPNSVANPGSIVTTMPGSRTVGSPNARLGGSVVESPRPWPTRPASPDTEDVSGIPRPAMASSQYAAISLTGLPGVTRATAARVISQIAPRTTAVAERDRNAGSPSSLPTRSG